ncbi:hypothetical protein CSV75_15725 [Sporosarcina sp. P18a]|uniref:hypothetical protein n=1 Tax=unclassified Sporosarcina TaxID=2647733 RepID=UPI000C16DA8B|nr:MULTISPECIES: hypothetical protein [unclassified Sporosarcina]PIC68975.1 hypothetical protein CSV77_16180 [Sporosarcina sp. P16b]PIC78662.1 hypothetical protein CSV75_15725 [Sporosarcina sp. P18a]
MTSTEKGGSKGLKKLMRRLIFQEKLSYTGNGANSTLVKGDAMIFGIEFKGRVDLEVSKVLGEWITLCVDKS